MGAKICTHRGIRLTMAYSLSWILSIFDEFCFMFDNTYLLYFLYKLLNWRGWIPCFGYFVIFHQLIGYYHH